MFFLQIRERMDNKLIQRNPLNSLECTLFGSYARAGIFETGFSIGPTIWFRQHSQPFPTNRAVHQASQQSVGLSVRSVVFLSNLIQHILCFYPFVRSDKTFMAAHGNNPFTDWFLREKLWKLGIKESGILVLNLHLIGFIIGWKPMLSIELRHFSKQISIMLQKVIVGILIRYTVDRVTQNQPYGRSSKFRTVFCFVSLTDNICRL